MRSGRGWVWLGSLGVLLAMSACDSELFATYTPTARPTRDPTSPPVLAPPTETVVASTAAPTVEAPLAPTSAPAPGFPPVAETAPNCMPRWFVTPPPDLCAAEA